MAEENITHIYSREATCRVHNPEKLVAENSLAFNLLLGNHQDRKLEEGFVGPLFWVPRSCLNGAALDWMRYMCSLCSDFRVRLKSEHSVIVYVTVLLRCASGLGRVGLKGGRLICIGEAARQWRGTPKYRWRGARWSYSARWCGPGRGACDSRRGSGGGGGCGDSGVGGGGGVVGRARALLSLRLAAETSRAAAQQNPNSSRSHET